MLRRLCFCCLASTQGRPLLALLLGGASPGCCLALTRCALCLALKSGCYVTMGLY